MKSFSCFFRIFETFWIHLRALSLFLSIYYILTYFEAKGVVMYCATMLNVYCLMFIHNNETFICIFISKVLCSPDWLIGTKKVSFVSCCMNHLSIWLKIDVNYASKKMITTAFISSTNFQMFCIFFSFLAKAYF